MNRDLRRRLAALEARPRASEFLKVDGLRVVGAGLYVPLPMAADAWERLARDSQAELTELEQRIDA
ncbi:hypothetical protein [Dokdonella sp.]|uniref:hypothetical protein n=1 Tax=Dokdonella sp. TaxID=2291710 RepID=UPI0037848914